MLDTKYSPQKAFDVRAAAAKLDTAVDNVSKLPVFSVIKYEDVYQIINYYDRSVVINYIPTRKIADKICRRYNRNNPFTYTQKKDLQNLLDRYSMLESEKIHYSRILESKSAREIYDIIKSRYLSAKDRQGIVEHRILALI
jgi:hypothetical protein